MNIAVPPRCRKGFLLLYIVISRYFVSIAIMRWRCIVPNEKTAVLIYNQFCNFEIAPALEMLAMAEKPITVFAKSLAPVRSEEGLTVIPERALRN